MAPPSPYPEHENLRALNAGEKRGVTNFLEWLGENEFEICVRHEGENFAVYEPSRNRIQDWLAEFFGIDQQALEREKLAMLEDLIASRKT